ncbi:DUF3592 domain-containing protein [Rhodocytophaga rosea]|uniref:DUF3592 domain-containing protein n=1 Tax=Rhodocytophaga rosea TaxID=2704465 RepID=A0A6C0GQS0_9BACT|nr:DUF3592 domain-containing protein [Rhodocytophaga rosea]QHT70409.1 DUF3592 domain-containing protein [Rhodocytophaga rosea]
MTSGGLVLFIGGAFFSIISFKRYKQEKRLKNNGIKTTGIIVDIIEKVDDGTFYHPIIEFKTIKGEVVKFEGVSSMDKPIINDQIELLYNEDNPQEAVEEDGVASKGGIYFAIVLLILSLLDLFSIINLTYESGTPKT